MRASAVQAVGAGTNIMRMPAIMPRVGATARAASNQGPRPSGTPTTVRVRVTVSGARGRVINIIA